MVGERERERVVGDWSGGEALGEERDFLGLRRKKERMEDEEGVGEEWEAAIESWSDVAVVR